MQTNIQIAGEIYLKSMNTMKRILDLVEFKFDKRTKEYGYFKSQIMDYTYENLKKLFKHMEDNKVLKKCPNGCNLRQGFKRCLCKGCGYINSENE